MLFLKQKMMQSENQAPKITAYIMAKNEESRIVSCIDSLQWCDDVVVADTGSTDNTVEIARNKGCRIMEVPFKGFGPTRNSIIDKIESPWIVCFDADEICTPELAAEIQQVARTNRASAYLANRLTFLMGKPVKHSGWNPDFRHAVLFKKGEYRYTERNIHESFHCSGEVEKLKAVFYHNSFPSLSNMLDKEKYYSLLGAKELLKQGKNVSVVKGAAHGIWAFCRHFFIKKGFLDGWRGLLVASSSAHATLFRYALAYEMKSKREAEEELSRRNHERT